MQYNMQLIYTRTLSNAGQKTRSFHKDCSLRSTVRMKLRYTALKDVHGQSNLTINYDMCSMDKIKQRFE